MSLQNLTRFPRLELIGAPTPLEYLPRLSDHLGREIFIKRDDTTPLAMGGNKLRKLEFLAADALREGADTLITAGAIQSNHVRQTAAVAAKLGLHCVALLENPIGTGAENYLSNGNRLLLDLFTTQVEMCDALTDPAAQLDELATRIEAQGYRPYVIPVGGSNALGALGYVESALEIAQQQEGAGMSRKAILTRYVLANPYIWLLSLCYVLVYVVRAAINDWGNLYMSETLGVDLVTANSAVTMFELGGFIGALVAGWGSDKLFNGNRGPMNLIFAAGILLSVGGLWLMPFASYVMQAACFFTTGFFVFGPQMLIGMAAAECSHKEAAGAATGFVGLFAYLGASLSGWPLAQVMDIWHWTGFFVVIAIAAGISALLLLPFLNAQAPRTASEA